MTPTPAPTATPAPATSTQTVTGGAAPATATFVPISSGLSGVVTVPVATAGTATITEVLSAALPSSAPALASVTRAPRNIGANGIVGVAYVSFTPSANISFATTPSFTFTVTNASLVTAPTPAYVAFYDPNPPASGWTTLLGPVTIGGGATTWTFPAGPYPISFKAGSTYVFAVFVAIGAVATPSPSPAPTATPAATATPVPTATPASFGVAPSIGLLDPVGGAFGGSTASSSTSVVLAGIASHLQRSNRTAVTVSGLVSVGVNGVGGLSHRRASSRPAVDRSGLTAEFQPESNVLVGREMRSAIQRNPVGVHTQGVRHTRSLPTTAGATGKLWAQNAAIGTSSGTYKLVDATLAAVTAHGYIWIDSSLSSVLSSSSTIQQIGVDVENAYASDDAHFGTNIYDPSVYRASPTCDSTGATTGTALPFAPSDVRTVVFVVNPASLGGGVGGYFDSANLFTDAVLQCSASLRTAGVHSNEAPTIYLGWFGPGGGSSSLSYVLTEDIVRGSAHEYQHLLNFIHHVIVANASSGEDTFINEGLSMLAQDLAVPRLYPTIGNDISDAMRHANMFLDAPQNFSLTGFSGIDDTTVSTSPAFNCSGCYGASYLFQRYLYDRFGGNSYLAQVETGAATGMPNIAAITGESADLLLGEFGVMLAANGQSTDARFKMPGFPFGQSLTSQTGAHVTASRTATVNAGSPGPGIFTGPFDGGYVFVSVPGAGATVSIREKTGNALTFRGGISQH